MHQDRDLDLTTELPDHADDIVFDLELEAVLEAMAAGDRLVFGVARRALLLGLEDPEAIGYRQPILADCLERPDVVRGIYRMAVDAVQAERKVWGSVSSSPGSILHRSTQVMEIFVGVLRQLRKVADESGARFTSPGFTRFFAMLEDELDDAYFETVESHLGELKFKKGVFVSARIGKGNTGIGYVLRRPKQRRLVARIPGRGRSSYSFEVAPRDEAGMQALGELRARGINLVANALAQSVDHVRDFFTLLAHELAFYVGCLNLYERMAGKGEPLCMPAPAAPGCGTLYATGLYDVALSLHLTGRAVGNELRADGKRLVVITGANQGGKSTLMRAIGQAQLMMQSGMFVAAEAFGAEVVGGVFTHYKREEDPGLEHGKLEEELSRMRRVVEAITPGCLLLCNESFASTNEREGSEIGRQVLRAMSDAGVKVVFVTHLYDLAHGLYASGSRTSVFLRAERLDDGHRTYKLYEGEPLSTSFGADTYRSVFDRDRSAAARERAAVSGS